VAKNDKMEIEHPVGIHQDYFLTEHIPNWIGAQWGAGLSITK
jgi:hypothetical protein